MGSRFAFRKNGKRPKVNKTLKIMILMEFSYKCKIKLKKGMRYEYKFRFGEESWETGNNRIIEL